MAVSIKDTQSNPGAEIDSAAIQIGGLGARMGGCGRLYCGRNSLKREEEEEEEEEVH